MKKLLSAIILSTAFLFTTPLHAEETFRTDFNDARDLTNWNLLQIEGWAQKWRDVSIQNGSLRIEPHSSSWYEDHIGGYLYREVEGDFSITTRIHVSGINSPLPQHEYSLAGLLIRNPIDIDPDNWQTGRENWLFLSMGTATPAGEPHYEVKTTINSHSTLEVLPRSGTVSELRITRQNTEFRLQVRENNSTIWQELANFNRPDMPNRLQIGITAYADWQNVKRTGNAAHTNHIGTIEDNADMIAYYDWVEIHQE